MSSYAGEDGMLRHNVNISVERIELDSSIVTSLKQPEAKAEANAGDITDFQFEQLFFWLDGNESVQLSAKTNLKKVKKALVNERKEEAARKKEEMALGNVDDGDEPEDEEGEKFLQEMKEDAMKKQEARSKRRKTDKKTRNSVAVMIQDDGNDEMDISEEGDSAFRIPPRASSMRTTRQMDPELQADTIRSIKEGVDQLPRLTPQDKGKNKEKL